MTESKIRLIRFQKLLTHALDILRLPYPTLTRTYNAVVRFPMIDKQYNGDYINFLIHEDENTFRTIRNIGTQSIALLTQAQELAKIIKDVDWSSSNASDDSFDSEIIDTISCTHIITDKSLEELMTKIAEFNNTMNKHSHNYVITSSDIKWKDEPTVGMVRNTTWIWIVNYTIDEILIPYQS